MWFAQDGALGSDTHDSSALVMDQTEDTLAVSSSSPSAAHAASPAERRSSGSQHELKASGSRLSFADLPSHTVVGARGTLSYFLANASAYRILEGAFVMHCYDHTKNEIDTRDFEYIIADPSGPNRWCCSCQKFALSANHSCFHALAAGRLSKKMRATAEPHQHVIACGKNNTVWAVLGGLGCFRSIVQLKDKQV
jgi:hypothetical protein